MNRRYALTQLAILFTCSIAFAQQGPDPIEGGGGCTEDIWLDITMDNFGGDITWEVIHVPSNSVAASGGPYANGMAGTVESNYMCLLKECYRLVIYDDAGNGIQNGGYVLRDAYGNRIIEGDGQFGSQSAIANGGDFCLPLSSNSLIDSWCDRTSLQFAGHTQIYASNRPGSSGYQFWLFDPHGTYSRRVYVITQNLHPMYLVTNPVPPDLDLNVRVRCLMNGQFSEFGRACIVRFNSPAMQSTRSSSFDEGAITSLNMYPNPVPIGSSVMINMQGLDTDATAAQVSLIDLAGRPVLERRFAVSYGQLRKELQIPATIPSGMYVVRVTAKGKQHTTRLMVR